jgi:hypothetical protein
VLAASRYGWLPSVPSSRTGRAPYIAAEGSSMANRVLPKVWGGMTSLPLLMQQCGGSEVGCALFSKYDTGTTVVL